MSKELDIGISKIARQKVIDHLKQAYAADYLEDKDLEKRLDIAENTQKRSELAFLVEDLPIEEIRKPASPDKQPLNKDTPYHLNSGNVRRSENFVSILSGNTRKGVWRPAKYIKATAILGGVDLDFTEALIPPEGIVIKIFAMMGGVDIRVPEGVHVVSTGFSLLGGFDNMVHGEVLPGAPTVHVRGFALLGGVDIKGPKKSNVFKRLINKILE